ncbi:MAG: hypothetical protein WD336_02980 [Trueperaceae bacterium]
MTNVRNRILRTLAAVLLVLATATALAGHVALEAGDQEVRGTTITLDRVLLEEDGFVVVHATDADGGLVLTPPLGLTYLMAGEHMNVTVDLDPDQLAEYGYHEGGSIVPMLHVDANNNRTYEFPDGPDVPVTEGGAPVVVSVDLTLLPSLATFDQTLAGGSVTIDTVIAAEDGFVVVHALDRDGNAVLTPPLGVASVPAGVSRFVTIDLMADGLNEHGYDEGPKAIVPMLHVDANDNGSYEFPEGPDVPVVADGDALVSPLVLSMPMMDGAGVVPAAPRLNVSNDGLSVTLAEATLTQPGFVALHATEADGSLRVLPILGASGFLEAGTHQDVTIWIDDDQAPVIGDTVVTMIHVDDGDRVYRFPRSDGPAMQDGAMILSEFTLR